MSLRRAIGETWKAGRLRRLGRPGVAGRLDPALAGFVIAAGAALGGAGLWMAYNEDAYGRFDPQLLEPVVDRRILSDFRASSSPFADAVLVDDRLYIGRRDGTVHVYSASQERFFDESIDRGGTALAGDMSLMGDACGPMRGPDLPACTAVGTIAAVTNRGGVARRDGVWRVLLGDGAWIGRDGQPVEQADVAVWAASDDGRHVLAETTGRDAALFDQATSTWRSLRLTGPASARVVFAHGAFWLAGPGGLERVDVRSGTATKITGAADYLDLDRLEDGRLLAIRSGVPCTGCLAIVEIAADGKERVLVGEGELPARLSAAQLHRVAAQGGGFVVAGSAGLFSYDMTRRSWRTLATGDVQADWVDADGRRLIAAIGRRVLTVEGGIVSRSQDVQEALIQIAPVGGRVFGLDRSGRVIDLTPDQPQILIPVDPVPSETARYATAAASGDIFFALGSEGLLIHDVRARRFALQPADRLPRDLGVMSDPQLIATREASWLVERATGAVFLIGLSGDWPLVQATFTPVAWPSGLTTRPLVTAKAQGTGLTLTASDGSVWTAESGLPVLSPQQGAGGPPSLVPKAVAGIADGLLLTDGRQIWSYSVPDRAWSGPVQAALDGPLQDLALQSDRILALTETGSLWETKDLARWQPLVGGGGGAAVGLDALTDAIQSGNELYLGGDGTVASYSLARRAFAGSWAGGEGAVRLVSVTSQGPLWLSGGVLRRGSSVVSQRDIRVLGAWEGPSGPVLLESPFAGGALHLRDLASDRCLFRGSAPPVGAVVDARRLPDGRLVVLTEQAMGLYTPDLRRWNSMNRPPVGDRMELIGAHLVVAGDSAFAAVPVSGIPMPASCDPGPVTVSWTQTGGLRSLSLDSASSRIHLLSGDGAVSIWSDGALSPVLPAVTAGPPAGSWHRVWNLGSAIAVATKDALWRYDLASRTWRRTPYAGASSLIAEASAIGIDATNATVTVWDGAGNSLGARESGGRLDLQTLVLPDWPVFTGPPSSILDIALRDGITAVVGEDKLQVSRTGRSVEVSLPRGEAWVGSIPASGRMAVVRTGTGGRPESISLFLDSPTSGFLADQTWRYAPGDDLTWAFAPNDLWRIDSDYALWRCPIEGTGAVPQGCVEAAAPPMEVAAGDVMASLPDGAGATLLLYRAGDDVRLSSLDAGLRHPTRIEGPQVSDRSALFSGPSGGAFLLDGAGGTLWSLLGGRAIPLARGVLRIIRAGDRLFAVTDDQTIEVNSVEAVAEVAEGTILDGAGVPAQLVQDRRVALPGGIVEVRPEAPVAVVNLDLEIRALDGAAEARLVVEADGGIDLYVCLVSPRPGSPLAGVPCSRPTRLLTLPPGDRLVAVQGRNGQLLLRTLTQDSAVDLSAPLARPQVSTAPLAEQTAADLRAAEDLKGRIVLRGGRSLLAPPAITDDGSLRMTVDRGTEQEALLATILPERWREWSMAGVAWDRAARAVVFGRDASARRVPVETAIRDGRLLPALPARAALLPDGRWSLANAAGLWHLVAGVITPVLIEELPEAVSLSGATFVLSDGTGRDATTGAQKTVALVESFVAAGIRVETRREGGARAAITVDRQEVDALGSEGLLIDQRLAVAGLDGTPALLTPIGLVGATFAEAIRPPAGVFRLANERGDLLAGAQDAWWRRTTSGWIPSEAPEATRTLAEESGRRWQRDGGLVGIVPVDPAQAWRVSGAGLDFAANRLLALAATPQSIVAITGVGTEVASTAAGLGPPPGPVAADPGALRLDAMVDQPGMTILWAETAAGPQVWDATQSAWVAPDPSRAPWLARIAARAGDLAIGFRDGIPWATVEVTGPDGRKAPAPLTWPRSGQMPFDAVTALHTEAGRLLLGTAFGLRLLEPTGPGSVGLFAPDAGAGPLPVRRLGRPAADPSRLLVDVMGNCLDATLPGPPQPCKDASGLAERQAIASPFWIWTERDEAAAGAYRLSNGTDLPIPPILSDGFPHDLRRSAMACGSDWLELWQSSGVISRWPAGGGAVRLDIVPGASDLYCEPDALPLGGGDTLARGAYALGSGPGSQLSASGAWTTISAAKSAAATARAGGRIPYAADRLRYLLSENAGLQLDYRSRDDQWRGLSLPNATFPLDRINAIAGVGSDLIALTPVGATRRVGAGIDPEAMLLSNPTRPGALAECAVDRIEVLDGREQAVPAEAGSPLRFRCRDGRVYQGSAVGPSDVGGLSEAATDPFQDRRPLVSNDLWTWNLVDRPPGSPGSLDIRFRDEPLSLDGGRFDIDAYRALSGPLEGRIELVAGNGWWVHPDGRLDLAAAARETGFATAAETDFVSADRDEGGAIVLCVSGTNPQLRDPAGTWRDVDSCREIADQGGDPLWDWFATAAGPLAETLSRNGIRLQRAIVAGRFSDLVATGAPVVLEGDHLLVPTIPGAIVLQDGRPAGIYAGTESLLPLRSDDGGLVLASRSDLISVEGSSTTPECVGAPGFLAGLPADTVLRKATRHSAALLTLSLVIADRRTDVLLDCSALGRAREWSLSADLSGRYRLAAQAGDWPSDSAELLLTATEGGLAVEALGLKPFVFSGLPGTDLLSLALDASRKSAFVLTRDNLFVMDMDRLILEIARNGERSGQPAEGGAAPGATNLADPPAPGATNPAAPPALSPPPDAGTVQGDPNAADIAGDAAGQDPAGHGSLGQDANTAEAPPDPEPIVPFGMTPDIVRQVQTALIDLGYNPGPVDGIFGSRSQDALDDWRRARGFADGGPLTERDVRLLLQEGST